MHGRPRDYKKKLQDPRVQEAHKKKVEAIRNGTALILACRQQKRYDEAVMVAASKLLKVVPEIYTIWNFRREALQELLSSGGEAAQRASDAELALTQACLMENPKSYAAWFQRKWVVSFGFADLEAELALINRALDEDSRNFHAWNYRQFLVRRACRPLDLELQYSEDKICQDFSNYSAWHYRTIVLHALHSPSDAAASGHSAVAAPPAPSAAPQALQEGPPQSRAHHLVSSLPGLALGSASQTRPIPVEVLDQEYDMVHQAFATDSKDESPWMYYRWLVGNSLAHVERAGEGLVEGPDRERAAQAAKDALAKVLAREVGRMEVDHLASEPDAKWPLLTLARLREAQVRLGLCGPGEDPERVGEDIRDVYDRLERLDPQRAGYYRDAREGHAFVVVSALGTV